MTNQDLLEIRAIESVLVRYGTVLDNRDYQQLSEVFIDEAVAHYIGVAECRGLPAIIRLVSGVLDQCGITQHLLGNFRISLDGDRATACCYLQAIHTGKGAYADSLHTVWGEYRDELIKGENGWRISHRVLDPLHATGDIGLQPVAS